VALIASLVLFSESGGRNTGLTRRGLFDNKKFFQIGFMVLALSGLLVTAEDLIYFGLNSTKFHWSSSDLLMVGLSNLANVVFAILFLRYLSKKYNAALALTTLTLTVVGWIGYLASISPHVMHNVPPMIPLIGRWCQIAACTGSPLESILWPFMWGSGFSFGIYNFYVNADFVVKLLFFGLCILKYPRETVRPVRSMAAHA